MDKETGNNENIEEKEKINWKSEIFKILVTALVTSIATCFVWGIQTYSENKREDKFKKIEIIQEYVNVTIKYSGLYDVIIDNKQMWIEALLLHEYDSSMGIESDSDYLTEFSEKEEIYREKYLELTAEYYGILTAVDIMFSPKADIDEYAQMAQMELQKGFGLDFDKYRDYFWEQVDMHGGTISLDEATTILNEINKMIEEDSVNSFSEYSLKYINALKEMIE